MNNSKKFWAVWRETGGGAPQKRHDSFESARCEAERLARQEKSNFFILETVGRVVLVHAPVSYEVID